MIDPGIAFTPLGLVSEPIVAIGMKSSKGLQLVDSKVYTAYVCGIAAVIKDAERQLGFNYVCINITQWPDREVFVYSYNDCTFHQNMEM